MSLSPVGMLPVCRAAQCTHTLLPGRRPGSAGPADDLSGGQEFSPVLSRVTLVAPVLNTCSGGGGGGGSATFSLYWCCRSVSAHTLDELMMVLLRMMVQNWKVTLAGACSRLTNNNKGRWEKGKWAVDSDRGSGTDVTSAQ